MSNLISYSTFSLHFLPPPSSFSLYLLHTHQNINKHHLHCSMSIPVKALNSQDWRREQNIASELEMPEAPPYLSNSADGPAESLEHIDLGSTPQLDVPVASETASRNTYKEQLRYHQNLGFIGENSGVGASVPNTFKHKSHPNAKTKERIGMAPLQESQPDEETHKASLPSYPVKTSTVKSIDINSQDHSTKQNETPSWMPQVLREEWLKSKISVPEENQEQMPNLDFLGGQESNTFIHNPQNSQEHPATPIWKRMSKDYMLNTRSKPLQSIFQTSDESKGNLHSGLSKSMSHLNVKNPNTPKNGHSAGLSYSSAFSTPVATKDGDIHLTQQQIHQLEDILEKAKDKPDDYPIKGSPLKLFGSDYDTFTKVFLSKFVDKVRSTANSTQKPTRNVSVLDKPGPKLEIQKFTKAGDYTDQDFMNNANHVFANIQKRVNQPRHLFSKRSDHSMSFQRSIEHNTVTSTPKADKVNDIDVIAPLEEFSSFSTNFEDSSAESHDDVRRNDTTNAHHNEYTSFDHSQTPRDALPNHEPVETQHDDVSVYTFDDISDTEQVQNHIAPQFNEPLENNKVRSQGDDYPKAHVAVNKYTSSMSSVKRHVKGAEPNHSMDDEENEKEEEAHSTFDNIDTMPPIVWKRPSRLRLSKNHANRRVMLNSNLENQINKGTVKPGKFPEQYGNMVFDLKNSRWVTKGKENDYPGSLDSILDLPTESQNHVEEQETKETSILKLSRKPSMREKNLEVSFQIPDKSFEYDLAESNHDDVTNVTDLGEVTFTQTHKRLVSLITGLIDTSAWKHVSYIDLSSKQLETVEGLLEYLPNLTRIDLSSNYIRFMKGVPRRCLELDLSQNSLDEMVSFSEHRDLQVLDILSNSLETLKLLQHNIHLSRLNISNNLLSSLHGLGKLSGLTYLNLSQNDLSGEIDFSHYYLPNLQELNLSENKLRSVTRIDSLPSLRILNLNENKLTNLSCSTAHPHLKKLLLKLNRLRTLDLAQFPLLRVLRIDGNALTKIPNLKNLKFLQEVSAKCQDSAGIAQDIVKSISDVVSMDMSGNAIISNMFSEPEHIPSLPFMNLNILNLSAVGLTAIPDSFGDVFPNVRELNLNFNKLIDIKGLSKINKLKKLNLVSNNIDRIEMVLTTLSSSRKSMKVLDMRLNSINLKLYPYVFNPLELDAASDQEPPAGPIQLEALDDIENFSIHYNSLIKSKEDWNTRDEEFLKNLEADGMGSRVRERLNYEALLVNFFPNMKELDGGIVSTFKRAQFLERIRERDLHGSVSA